MKVMVYLFIRIIDGDLYGISVSMTVTFMVYLYIKIIDDNIY